MHRTGSGQLAQGSFIEALGTGLIAAAQVKEGSRQLNHPAHHRIAGRLPVFFPGFVGVPEAAPAQLLQPSLQGRQNMSPRPAGPPKTPSRALRSLSGQSTRPARRACQGFRSPA